jgi:predicted RNA-binding protein with PIN domain
MAEPFLLIDGYNLMHAAGIARLHYGPGELERCRTLFLQYLLDCLRPRELARTSVVFDAGDAPPGMTRRTTLGGMQVFFANPGGDADTLIEELIAAHSAPRQIRLVSSDRRLQKAARRRRAAFVDSRVFAGELERRGAVSDEKRKRRNAERRLVDAKRSGHVSPEETEEWLEIFGDIPEAAELKREIDRWQSRIDELDPEGAD